MDVKSLHTFLTVDRLGNFTHAARELNYAQSTVSNQIQQLEKELGYPLFDRIGKQVSLTTMGQHFRPYAEEIFSIMQQVHVLGKEPQDMHSLLRMGALESLLYTSLVDVLPAYKRKYVNIELHVSVGFRETLYKRLKDNLLDLVYVSDDPIEDPALYCCYKRPERLIFVSDSQHELAHETKITLERVLSYPLIGLEPKGICRTRVDSLAMESNLLPKYTMIVENIRAMTELLSTLNGLSFVPYYCVCDRIQQGYLTELDVDMKPQIYYSQILYCKNKWVSPFMQGMIDMISAFRPETY